MGEVGVWQVEASGGGASGGNERSRQSAVSFEFHDCSIRFCFCKIEERTSSSSAQEVRVEALVNCCVLHLFVSSDYFVRPSPFTRPRVSSSQPVYATPSLNKLECESVESAPVMFNVLLPAQIFFRIPMTFFVKYFVHPHNSSGAVMRVGRAKFSKNFKLALNRFSTIF